MLFRVKEFLDGLALPLYLARGRRPWSPGCCTSKKTAICAAIDVGLFQQGDDLPDNHGCHLDERVVEYPWLFAQLQDRPGLILDAGSAFNHRFLLDRSALKHA